MNRTAQLAVAFAAGRVAFGIALTALPGRVGSSWIGSDAQRKPAQIAIRGLGARDVALAGGTIAAAARGGDLRRWLVACVGSDVADLAATLAAGDTIPDRARKGTVALAGSGALAGAALTIAAARR